MSDTVQMMKKTVMPKAKPMLRAAEKKISVRRIPSLTRIRE